MDLYADSSKVGGLVGFAQPGVQVLEVFIADRDLKVRPRLRAAQGVLDLRRCRLLIGRVAGHGDTEFDMHGALSHKAVL
jgi:hypothetical protein